eukprot:10518603-Lingulodinium_polyedra.AAC.1
MQQHPAFGDVDRRGMQRLNSALPQNVAAKANARAPRGGQLGPNLAPCLALARPAVGPALGSNALPGRSRLQPQNNDGRANDD